MLLHHANPELDRNSRAIDVDKLITEENFPFVRLRESVKNLHQRRFASAVFPDNRVNLSILQGEVYLIVRRDLSKPFGDVVHVDEWWIHERLNIRLNHPVNT